MSAPPPAEVSKLTCKIHNRQVSQECYDDYHTAYLQYPAHIIMCDMDCICKGINFKANIFRRAWDEEYRRYLNHKEIERLLSIDKAKKLEDKESKVGRWYFITFTQPDTITDPTDLLKRTRKVVTSKQVSAEHWIYSLELTEKGTPHTHIRLFSNKYFDYKKIGNFNNGFRYDIQPEKHRCDKYIVKDESKPTSAWLATYGLDTYWWKSENYSGATPDSVQLDISPDNVISLI